MKALLYPIAAAALMFAVNANAAHVDVQVDPSISTLDIAYDYTDAITNDRQTMSMGDYPVTQLKPWLQGFNSQIQKVTPNSTISFGIGGKTLNGCQKIPLKNQTIVTIKNANSIISCVVTN
jgi:hypothetical protein